MSESEIERLTDKYYNVAKECFEASRTWRDVIRKFPPQAIRSAVRRIVERFVRADEDLELFDFCDFFTEQLPEFESIDAFIEYLDKKRYIPPDPEDAFREWLTYLEQQANSIGYRLVKEEEWAKVTGRWDKLQSEVERLREEKRRLEARVRELEEALEKYKRTGKSKLTRFMAEPVTPTPTKKEKPPPPTKPPAPPPAKPKLIKETMSYDEFVGRIKAYLRGEGITDYLIDKIITEIEAHIKEIYETTSIDMITAELERIIMYVFEEFIPAKCSKVTGVELERIGVDVREPRPTRVYGVVMKPPISYIYPRFVDWANSLERAGYQVTYKPVQAIRGVHFIHEPGVPLDHLVVAIDKETGLIVLTSTSAIVYMLDEEKKTLVWYRYPVCRALLR